MQYFNEFPVINYNISGQTGNLKQVTDIWRRVKVSSVDYFWVVCLLNNVVNRFHDWPLDEFNFQQFVKDKYDNPGGIHHYEKTQSSGKQTGQGPSDFTHKIVVNSDELGAEAVSNIEHERRLQDKKRQIRLLSPNYLNAFVDEFRLLIRQ